MRCISPVTLKNERGDIPPFFTFPCGKCVYCQDRKIKEWTVRIQKELKYSDTANFITLTYAENPGTLIKEHIQLFFKKLRHVSKCRYYCVGEYGGNYGRPHWHILLFNFKGSQGDITRCWENGFIHCGDVRIQSIKYVLSYFFNVDGKKNVVMMSRRPGIGYKYLEMKEYHRKNKLFRINNPGGEVALLPRYYKDRFFTKMERRINDLKVRRVTDKKEKEVIISDALSGDNYYEQLKNRYEALKVSKIKNYKRRKL